MNVKRPSRITRHATLPSIHGIRRATTLEGLLKALEDPGLAATIVADLSLGEWRAHELARTCFAQTEQAWPLPEPSVEISGSQEAGWGWIDPGPADRDPSAAARQEHAGAMIGDWIDAEGRGESSVQQALWLAESLLDALGARPLELVVVAPAFGAKWRRGSLSFLTFLAHGVRPGDQLIIATLDESSPNLPGMSVQWRDAPPLPPRPAAPGLGALFPGALDRDAQQALDFADGYPLRGGLALVPPEWRCGFSKTSRMQFDRLSAASVPSWLKAFAQMHGNNYFVDPWFLCAQANLRLAEGGHEIALDLLERAATCARSLRDRAVLSALLQGHRIALMRYGEVVSAPDPSAALPDSLAGALHMTKGWGLVMSAQAERAEPYMQRARELLQPVLGPHATQFLYLLNISALNRLNLGDYETALRIEKEIEAVAAPPSSGECDYRLRYVNSINIARLYRRADRFDLAESYFDQAFETTAGARTQSDLIYTNVCQARLYTAQGHSIAAMRAWIRAALHWLSADAPEALGWRVLSAIVGRKATAVDASPEEVAQALFANLSKSAELSGVKLSSNPSAGQCVFVRAERAAAAPFLAIGAEGFSILLSNGPATPPRWLGDFRPVLTVHPSAAGKLADGGAFRGPQRDELAGLALALICGICNAGDLLKNVAILVDDRLGCEMAATREEIVDTAVRWNIGQTCWGGQSIPISSELRAELLRKASVQPGPAVARIDCGPAGAVVRFKRYFPARILSTDEASAVTRLVKEGEPLCPELFQVVRNLESDRVLAVRVTLK
jgi:tetratricopeptide (TPR) repeat protein